MGARAKGFSSRNGARSDDDKPHTARAVKMVARFATAPPSFHIIVIIIMIWVCMGARVPYILYI